MWQCGKYLTRYVAFGSKPAMTGGLPAMKALNCGDNLQVLRDSIATESVDLIYLDPPFNSKAKVRCRQSGVKRA